MLNVKAKSREKLPLEETQRLRAVENLCLLDRPEEERFRRITRLVRRHFRTAACSVTLVDEDRQFFVAQLGFPNRQTPRSESICSLVVDAKKPLIYTDLSENRQVQPFRGVIDNLGYNFYAGVPLWSPEGWPLGTICILDQAPRKFSERDLESLQDFAGIVEDEMSMARVDRSNQDLIQEVERLKMRAFVDALTGVWNRGALSELLARERERSLRGTSPLSVAILDIDFFKRVNDTYGHLVGDEVLKELASRLKGAVRPYDAVGRYGGEEFVVVFPETTAEDVLALGERLRAVVSETPFRVEERELPITISVGLSTSSGSQDEVEDLLERADKALYAAKRAGRNRVMAG